MTCSETEAVSRRHTAATQGSLMTENEKQIDSVILSSTIQESIREAKA